MTLTWTQIVIDSENPHTLAHWWSDVLGWPVIYEEDGEDEVEVAPHADAQPTLLFVPVPERKSLKNRLHLDFRPDDQAAEVERMLAVGATRVDVGQGDDVTWVVLADPEGNEFCILRAR